MIFWPEPPRRNRFSQRPCSLTGGDVLHSGHTRYYRTACTSYNCVPVRSGLSLIQPHSISRNALKKGRDVIPSPLTLPCEAFSIALQRDGLVHHSLLNYHTFLLPSYFASPLSDLWESPHPPTMEHVVKATFCRSTNLRIHPSLSSMLKDMSQNATVLYQATLCYSTNLL